MGYYYLKSFVTQDKICINYSICAKTRLALNSLFYLKCVLTIPLSKRIYNAAMNGILYITPRLECEGRDSNLNKIIGIKKNQNQSAYNFYNIQRLSEKCQN